MSTGIEAAQRAREIRERAAKGETPLELAREFSLSRGYVQSLILNKAAFDPSYFAPDRASEPRQAYLSTQVNILRSVGFSIRAIGKQLGLSRANAHRVGRKQLFSKQAAIEVELTKAITVGGKKLAVGQYSLSAYEKTIGELLVVGCGRSVFVTPLELVGKVEL